jgi:ABC-type transport system involved in cytochrome c biogenesis permease subunit
VATLVTMIGWFANTLALVTRAHERLQLSGTFAPWSNQFEAMACVSWAIILGYVLLECKYGLKAIEPLWSASGSLRWEPRLCCRTAIRPLNRWFPR